MKIYRLFLVSVTGVGLWLTTGSRAMEIPFQELAVSQHAVANLRSELGFAGKKVSEQQEKKYPVYLDTLEKTLRVQDDFIQVMVRVRDVNKAFNEADEKLQKIMGPKATKRADGTLVLSFKPKTVKADIATIALRDLLIELDPLKVATESLLRTIVRELLKDRSDESFCFIGNVIQAKLEFSLANRSYNAVQKDFLVELSKAFVVDQEARQLFFGRVVQKTGTRLGGLPAQGQKFIRNYTTFLAGALGNLEQHKGYFQVGGKGLALTNLFVSAADENLFSAYAKSREKQAALFAAVLQETSGDQRVVAPIETKVWDIEDEAAPCGSKKGKGKAVERVVASVAAAAGRAQEESENKSGADASSEKSDSDHESTENATPFKKVEKSYCSITFSEKVYEDMSDIVRYSVYKRFGAQRENLPAIREFSKNVQQWLSGSASSLMNFATDAALHEQGYYDDVSPKSLVAYSKEPFTDREDMKRRMVIYHAFPKNIDDYVYCYGQAQEKFDQKNGESLIFITALGDITLPSGEVKKGLYTYIVNKATGICFHRMFEPKELQWNDPRVAESEISSEAIA